MKTLMMICYRHLTSTSFSYVEPILKVILNNVSLFEGKGKDMADSAVNAASIFVSRNRNTTQFHMLTLTTKTIQIVERRSSAPSGVVVGDEMRKTASTTAETWSSDITNGMRKMML
jgi:hypothetical protein